MTYLSLDRDRRDVAHNMFAQTATVQHGTWGIYSQNPVFHLLVPPHANPRPMRTQDIAR
jgi:hypothetical protein